MKARKILIIDDDIDILKSLKVIIEDKGYNVLTASNNTDGLKLNVSEKPDAIVLDIMMENDLEGYSMLREFRNNDSMGNTPIIMYTGMAQQIGVNFRSAIEDQESLPNVSFVDKREDVEVLIEEIDKLFQE